MKRGKNLYIGVAGAEPAMCVVGNGKGVTVVRSLGCTLGGRVTLLPWVGWLAVGPLLPKDGVNLILWPAQELVVMHIGAVLLVAVTMGLGLAEIPQKPPGLVLFCGALAPRLNARGRGEVSVVLTAVGSS